MDEIFPGVILWLMLVFVAIVGGLVSFRSSIHPACAAARSYQMDMARHAADRRAGDGCVLRIRLGVDGVDGGSERGSGSADVLLWPGGTFIGMFEDRWRPAIRRNTARSELASHRRTHAPHRERAHLTWRG